MTTAAMTPFTTKFAVPDPYKYLDGLGNHHSSEDPSFPGSVPLVNTSPHHLLYKLRPERFSAGSMAAPRHLSRQAWFSRAKSSLGHSEFVPLELKTGYGPVSAPRHLTPNSYTWQTLPVPDKANWVDGQQLMGSNGDPQKKEGAALWVYSITESMPERQAFASHDGDVLIIPQSGALDIQTEQGKIMVRANEGLVIPRAIRYRVTLVNGQPSRGTITELYQGNFVLPELGVIGTSGLANRRDFQIPTAFFDGEKVGDVAKASPGEWTVICRVGLRLFQSKQAQTPFDVAGWHGTSYPFKYDFGRFCVLGNLRFDHHDPTLFTFLTARNFGAEPGTSVVDFTIVPEKWSVSEDTLRNPTWHRNTMQEFFGPIINSQDPAYPFNGGNQFGPFLAQLNSPMKSHGMSEKEFEAALKDDTTKPVKSGDDGLTFWLMETERPMLLSDWAYENAIKNEQPDIYYSED